MKAFDKKASEFDHFELPNSPPRVMDPKPLTSKPPWDLTPKEAIAVQKHLAGKVIRKSGIDIEDIATVAGVDTHFYQGLAIAAAVVIRLSDLATVDHATAVGKIRFPYISGLLSFREGPAILAEGRTVG